jgi:ribosomal protein S18 acetylase RimI-like enzyme
VQKASISFAGVSDAEQICRVIHDGFFEYERTLVPPSAALAETPRSIASELEGETAAWLAWIDGAAVGCVLARPKGVDLYFGRLSVLSSFRGRGIAVQLTSAVEDAASERGFAGVTCSVRLVLEANQRLFHRLGFSEVGRTAHPGFEEPTSIDLRKSLRGHSSQVV